MRGTKRSELNEAIRETVAEFAAVGRRFLNRDIVDAIIDQHGGLFDEMDGNSHGRNCLTSRAGS